MQLTNARKTYAGKVWLASLICLPFLIGCEKIDSADATDVGEQGLADVNRVDFRIGGQTIGLKGALTISYNGISQTIDKNGGFQFNSTIRAGTKYEVKVEKQPDTQICFTRNYTGIIAHSDNNSLVILCYDSDRIPFNAFSISAEPWNEQMRLTWQDLGAIEYNVYYSTNTNIDSNNWSSYLNEGLNTATCHTSPCVLSGLVNGNNHVAIIEAKFANKLSVVSSVMATPRGIEFDGSQKTIKSAHGRLYVGGDFTMAGYSVQNLVQSNIDSTATIPYLRHKFPNVNGVVNAVIADGADGWYIGGSFSEVDGIPRTGLAHILPDGQVDKKWRYDAAGTVNALALYYGKLYVGGNFSSVNRDGQLTNFVVINANGSVSNALPRLTNAVNCIAIAPNLQYPILVGGSFSPPYGGVVAIDGAGSIANWNFGLSNFFTNAIAVVGSKIFVGGSLFALPSGATTSVLAAFDASSLKPMVIDAGLLPDNTVNALASYGNTLFIGGAFQKIGTQMVPHLAALTVDPQITLANWSAAIPGISNQRSSQRNVKSLLVDRGHLYVGGTFDQIGGKIRSSIASFDLTTDGWPLTPWDLILGSKLVVNNYFDYGSVNAIAVNGKNVLLGGHISRAGGVRRNQLAALDANGFLTSWEPIKITDEGSTIEKIDANNSTIYFSGTFTTINGQPRPYLASSDTGGSILPFNLANAQRVSTPYLSSVNTFTVHGNTVYASTTDYTEGATYSLRAFDNLGYTKWINNPNLNLNNSAYDIAFFQNKLIVGGRNLTTSQPYLIAYDTNGVDLNVFSNTKFFSNSTIYNDNSVRMVHVVGERLFISGSQLWSMTDNTFANVATLDAQLAITPWSASLSDPALSIAVLGDAIYLSGLNLNAFGNILNGTTVTPFNQMYAAAFNTQGMISENWRPDFWNNLDGYGGVDELAVNGEWIYVVGNSGNFNYINGQPRDGFAALDNLGNLKRIEFIPPPWTASGR